MSPFIEDKTMLLNALRRFREEHGFGRAISAPQINIHKRMIALNGSNNPNLKKKSNFS